MILQVPERKVGITEWMLSKFGIQGFPGGTSFSGGRAVSFREGFSTFRGYNTSYLLDTAILIRVISYNSIYTTTTTTTTSHLQHLIRLVFRSEKYVEILHAFRREEVSTTMLTLLRWCAGPSALPPLKTGTPLAMNGVL